MSHKHDYKERATEYVAQQVDVYEKLISKEQVSPHKKHKKQISESKLANPNDVSPALNFRVFVEQLKKDGDLAEINMLVDSNLEVGAITRKVYDHRDKAALFNNVTGMNNGLFRVLGAPAGYRSDPDTRFGRIARHVGLDDTATEIEIQRKLTSARNVHPIPPRVIETGACKENIIRGDDVDLTMLPQLQLHTSDGGRYIQTYGVHMLHTSPNHCFKWTNWSIARGMLLPPEKYGKNKLICTTFQTQHIQMVWQTWKDYGKDCPWALAFGAPPLAAMIGGAPLPDFANECDYIGALAGVPLDVVKCETNDVLVPANSEIVFEGHISISEEADEGPFGEMHGYLWKGETLKFPVFTVDAITYRNGAILPISVAGRDVEECHTIIGITCAAGIHYTLKEAGIPVIQVHVPPETNTIWVVIKIDTCRLKAIHTTSDVFRKRIGETLWRNGRPGSMIHQAILVDERTDIFNFKDVAWALATRCRPNQMQTFFEDVDGYPLVPFMSHGPGKPYEGGKVVSDCLFPYQYDVASKHEYEVGNFTQGYSQEIQAKVNSRWKDMGFKTDP